MAAFDIQQWLTITAISASTSALVHLIPGIILAFRVKRWSGALFVVIFPVYTFFSSFFYSLFLSLIITLTYAASIYSLTTKTSSLWGLGFGIFYVLLKALIQYVIK